MQVQILIPKYSKTVYLVYFEQTFFHFFPQQFTMLTYPKALDTIAGIARLVAR